MIRGRRSSSFEVQTHQSLRADMFALWKRFHPSSPPSLEYVDLESIKRHVRKLKNKCYLSGLVYRFWPKATQTKRQRASYFSIWASASFQQGNKRPWRKDQVFVQEQNKGRSKNEATLALSEEFAFLTNGLLKFLMRSLRPNIHWQILQTDLHSFPVRVR